MYLYSSTTSSCSFLSSDPFAIVFSSFKHPRFSSARPGIRKTDQLLEQAWDTRAKGTRPRRPALFPVSINLVQMFQEEKLNKSYFSIRERSFQLQPPTVTCSPPRRE